MERLKDLPIPWTNKPEKLTQLDHSCPSCDRNEWYCVDYLRWYIEHCNRCEYKLEIKKSDLVDSFICKKCGGLEGTLEENAKLIGVRCNNCRELELFVHKHTTDDQRETSRQIEAASRDNRVRCPKCKSDQITSGARGVNFAWGFIGASKTVNRCAKCGHTWKPKK